MPSLFFSFVGSVLLSLAVVGCASLSGSGTHDPDYDFTKIDRVAVVSVEGASAVNREAVQNQIANMFNQALLDKGFSPIERSQINKILKEQEFSRSDVTRAEGAVQIGRVLNADTVVIVNVPRYGDKMEMSARMVDVETAEIVWSANGSASTGTGLGQGMGALFGAGAGAVAGGEVEEGEGTLLGGAAGAAGGAMAGEAMTPQRQEQAAKLIKRLAESLPGH